jgi:hypothetical protein
VSYKSRIKAYYYAITAGWDEAIKRIRADNYRGVGLDPNVIHATVNMEGGRQPYRRYNRRSRSRTPGRSYSSRPKSPSRRY